MLHRRLGGLHTVAALGWVGPTGFYLTPFAKGGLAAQAGFGLLAALFYLGTLFGLRAIRRGQRDRHVRWMVRSYAALTSALSFRALFPVLCATGVDPDPAYVLATWGSLGISVLLGEWAIVRLGAVRSGRGR